MEFDDLMTDSIEGSIGIRESLEKYYFQLKWYLLSLLIFISLSILFLRYSVPKYSISSTVLIKGTEEGNSVDQLQAFQDLGIFGSSDNSLENEIHILKSRRIIQNVIEELKLNVRYFRVNDPYDLEYYPNYPLILDAPSDSIGELKYDLKYPAVYFFSVLSSSEFELTDSEENFLGRYRFGDIISTELGDLRVNINPAEKDNLSGESIKVVFRPVNDVVDQYLARVNIEPMDENSRVLSLSVKDESPIKGVALINNLVQQYNIDAIDDKNLVYEKTTEFLNDRIVLITSELNAIESSVQLFKSSKGFIDPSAGAGLYLESSSANEQQLIEANTQLTLVDYMDNQLKANDLNEPLPVNIGLSDPSVLSLIGQYNELVLQRNRILKSSTLKNPLIIGIDSQISILKSNLKNSLNTIRSSLLIQLNSLNEQSGRLNSRIASVPKNEKDYKDIVRQLETKNQVYLFLLQKREESILSNAITVDRARVVDAAYANPLPVSPNRGITLLVGILMAFLIPTAVIYARDILDTKIHDEKDITRLGLPYIGDIPLAASKSEMTIKDGDNTAIAESFRYIRTNLEFMVENKDASRTIFVTSTQAGEGKSFVALNLARSIALSGKKTVLVGMDLRLPKLSSYLKIDDSIGVSNYVVNNNLSVNDVVVSGVDNPNLDFINSGNVPPNPVELLMSERVGELFSKLKQSYDYIIVDTAPVGMVTDTVQISKFSNMIIYVMRAEVFDKRLLHIPQRLNKERKLPNMAILINGTEYNRRRYGYGYGYSKREKKKGFLGLRNLI